MPLFSVTGLKVKQCPQGAAISWVSPEGQRVCSRAAGRGEAVRKGEVGKTKTYSHAEKRTDILYEGKKPCFSLDSHSL